MPTIRFDDAAVTVATPDGEREVLSPVDLTLTEHRVAIVGANGSGKSTLARMVNGLVTPSAGRVLVDDVDVARDPGRVRRRVGFCFTDPAAQLVMPTCLEDVELSLRRHERKRSVRLERARETLARFGLGDHADVSVHALSGGQRQLLALAGVLATDPDVVVADEPTTLLDLTNTRRVGELLLGLDQQLVLVTHDLDLAARCDRAVVVSHGRIVADDSPAAAIAAYRSLAEAGTA